LTAWWDRYKNQSRCEIGCKVVSANHSPPPGLSVFDSLRAEDEPWLDQCFVPPPDFDLIAGARSSLVFGAVGSGKTVLFQALLARLTPPQTQKELPSRLIVNWRPVPLEPGASGSAAAAVQLTHVLSGCADALLAYLARWPDKFTIAPADIQQTLVWFIHHHLEADARQRITAHAAQAQESGRSLLRSLLSRERSDEWLSAARPATIINELVKALREIGPRAVYVLVNPDTLGDPEQVESSLHAFLSSLTLFENRHFVYKMVLPAKLKESLASTGVVNRRRVDVYPLSWSVEDLTEIVVRRTAVAAGEPVSGLTEICEDIELVRWLERTGGDSPRGWLECVTPLVAQYLRRRRRISTQEWKAIRTKSPPPLVFNDEDESVTVGWRCIDDLPEVPLALLRYLYDHRNRVCTRDELYHQAYLSARYPDAPPEERREYPEEYDGVLDTVISRLRQKIEPDPRPPIYVVTKRDRGYKLDHVW
jgi:hypothetical protein